MRWFLDTGILLRLLDRSDPHHADIRRALSRLRYERRPRCVHRLAQAADQRAGHPGLGLHPDIDPPVVLPVVLAAMLLVWVPGCLHLLHSPRQHPGDNVCVPDGGSLPVRNFVVAELVEEDALGDTMVHSRPELLLLDARESLIQVEIDTGPRLLRELPQLLNPAAFIGRPGHLFTDLERKGDERGEPLVGHPEELVL
jgi:hypothetical protein